MRLSLATRIFLGYAVVLITFGAVSLFSVSEMHRNQVEFRLVSEGYLHLSQDVAAIETFHKNRERDTVRLQAETNPQMQKALIKLAELFPGLMAERLTAVRKTIAEVKTFAPDSEAQFVEQTRVKIEELARRYGEYESATEALFSELQSAKAPEVLDSQFERVRQMESTIGVTLRLLHGAIEQRIAERVTRAQERERRTGVLVIGLPVLAIAIGLLATAFSARSLRPVRTLIEGASRVGRGDYSAQIGLKGDDEIALLGREFDQMAKSLRERQALLEQKQAELLRVERLAAVGKVSAQIAHEVRNPLSSIGLNVEMLDEQLSRAKFDSPDEAKETKDLLASVIREVDRLTEVTETYLRLARLPAPVLQPEDLHGLIDKVLAFTHEELSRHKIDVKLERAQGEVRVQADESQLRQVVLNLIRNAREAMAGGGTLTLRTRRVDDKYAELEVQDTGPGIAAAARERIFEPFFSTKQQGTGLGLSLSRQILEAHHGQLELRAGELPGTCFVLRLPRA